MGLDTPEIDHVVVKQSNEAYEFTLLDGVTEASFTELLRWLPPSYELQFYDQYYPSMSDPGAYVSVQRKENHFIYKLGNHGWSSDWSAQSPELLAAWLLLNMKKKSNYTKSLSSISVKKVLRNPWPK